MTEAADVYLIDAGAGLVCLFCHNDRLGTTTPAPAPGDPVFCGACGGLMELAAAPDGRPVLGRVSGALGEALRRRPEVRAVRDAFALDQLEARLPAASEKSKSKGPRIRVRSGDRLSFTARGPDA